MRFIKLNLMEAYTKQGQPALGSSYNNPQPEFKVMASGEQVYIQPERICQIAIRQGATQVVVEPHGQVFNVVETPEQIMELVK